MNMADLRINPRSAASKTARETHSWPVTPESLAETVEACQRRDPIAQHRLYEATHRNVYRLMAGMVGPQDASDLTQQVFLQVFRKIDQFCGRSGFGTWIYRVAVNEALQYLRQSKRLLYLEREPMDHSADGNKNCDDKELLELALQRLEPDLRSAFLLREVEGLSYNEISQALQIPEGTVGSRLNQARRELRDHLIELGWEP